MPRISLAGTLIVSALGAVTLTETSVLEMSETSPDTGRSRLRVTVSAAPAGNAAATIVHSERTDVRLRRVMMQFIRLLWLERVYRFALAGGGLGSPKSRSGSAAATRGRRFFFFPPARKKYAPPPATATTIATMAIQPVPEAGFGLASAAAFFVFFRLVLVVADPSLSALARSSSWASRSAASAFARSSLERLRRSRSATSLPRICSIPESSIACWILRNSRLKRAHDSPPPRLGMSIAGRSTDLYASPSNFLRLASDD